MMTEVQQDRVSVSRERMLELLRCEDKLIALENAGVDNWDGYDFAMEEFHSYSTRETE